MSQVYFSKLDDLRFFSLVSADNSSLGLASVLDPGVQSAGWTDMPGCLFSVSNCLYSSRLSTQFLRLYQVDH